MVISLEWYKTSQQALIWDENAIQKQWQETPWYNMFNTWNTGTTSPAYDTTTVDVDIEKTAKDREVEAWLWITLSSPMTDAEKKQYLNSISDEQYKLMRTYKNQWYSFEASKALMENADTLKNPTKRWTKKYKPKETAWQKAADVWMWILQSPWKRWYNIIWQRIDKAAERIADKLQWSALQRAVYNWAVKVFWEDAVKAYQDETQKQIDNWTIFDGRTQTDILTPTLWYQRANYSNWTKAWEFIWDIATDAALSAPMWAALKPRFKTATLWWKALLWWLEWATSMWAFTYWTEGRAPTAWELALGAWLWVAVPLAWAWVKWAKNAIKTEAWAWAEKLIEKITKVSPAKLQKFENQFGENVGKFMNDRWLKTRKDIADYFTNSTRKVDEALWSIQWTFKSPVVDDVLTESVEFATKTADENLNRLLELQQKAANEWLTMSEVNEVKRYFEWHTKFTYGKSQDAVKASKATNLDTRLREWQRQIAKESWLDNLAQLNRETQASRYILDNAKDAQKWVLWAVDVTDELLAIHYGWLDRALATYATKSLLKSPKFQAKAVDILNRLAWHQNIEAVLADLEKISKVNTEKEFEALMKKRELDQALPAPKAWWVNDAWYNILEQWENIISKPDWTNIVQDSITEIK